MKYYIQKIFFTFCFFLMAFKRRKNKEKWVFLFRTDHLGDLLASISVLRHFTACYQQKGYRVAIVVDAPLQWVIEKSVPCDKVYPILVQKVQTDLRYRMNVLLDFYRYPIQTMISLVSSPIALCFLEIFLFAKESHRFIGDWSEVPFFFDFYKRRYDYTYRIMYNSSIHDQLEEVFQKITGQKSKYESPDFYQIFDEIGVLPPCTGKYYLVFSIRGRARYLVSDKPFEDFEVVDDTLIPCAGVPKCAQWNGKLIFTGFEPIDGYAGTMTFKSATADEGGILVFEDLKK